MRQPLTSHSSEGRSCCSQTGVWVTWGSCFSNGGGEGMDPDPNPLNNSGALSTVTAALPLF